MRQLRVLIRKEILDILRDKKTLVMMVVVPVLLYPLIIIGMSLMMTMFMGDSQEHVHLVGISDTYAEFAGELEQLYEKNKDDLERRLEFVTADPADQAVRDEVEVWLDVTRDSLLHVAIEYASTDQDARYAQETVENLMELYCEEQVVRSLEAEGLPESILHPVTYETEDLASVSESLGMDIGGSIGLMLIVTILLGAIYPAIDATAGEKERGTLETLLTLPVTNFQMIGAKYVSVALFSCVTAVISLLSLGGSVLFLIYGIAGAGMEETQLLSFSGILTMLPVLMVTMITTALMISALCMCFCVFAKSFKEANNYVTPLMLVIMFASMAAMIPSVTLDYRTALIPVVNVSLMVKQIISQQFDLRLAGLTNVVNVGCSLLVIWVLAKIYNSEDILFTDGFRSFRLFRARRELQFGTVPASGDLVITVTVLFLLILYIGSAVSVRLGFAGTAVNQLLILAVPLFAVWYMKADWKKLFSLKIPEWKKVPGAVLVWLGAWCGGMGLSFLLSPLMSESMQNLELAFEPVAEEPLWFLVLVIAVMPAIGEEIMFRGYLFGSLRERTKVRWAVVISALIFGAFHMSLIKLLPTFLLGAAFASSVASTGSLWVTMILHFLNNLLSLIAMKFPEQTGRYLPFLVEEKASVAVTAALLTAGVLCAGCGFAIFRTKKSVRQDIRIS